MKRIGLLLVFCYYIYFEKVNEKYKYIKNKIFFLQEEYKN